MPTKALPPRVGGPFFRPFASPVQKIASEVSDGRVGVNPSAFAARPPNCKESVGRPRCRETGFCRCSKGRHMAFLESSTEHGPSAPDLTTNDRTYSMWGSMAQNQSTKTGESTWFQTSYHTTYIFFRSPNSMFCFRGFPFSHRLAAFYDIQDSVAPGVGLAAVQSRGMPSTSSDRERTDPATIFLCYFLSNV